MYFRIGELQNTSINQFSSQGTTSSFPSKASSSALNANAEGSIVSGRWVLDVYRKTGHVNVNLNRKQKWNRLCPIHCHYQKLWFYNVEYVVFKSHPRTKGVFFELCPARGFLKRWNTIWPGVCLGIYKSYTHWRPGHQGPAQKPMTCENTK